MASPRKAEVLVADPEPVARTGLIHLVNSHVALRVSGEAETLPQARDHCERHKPDVLIIDPLMGGGLGFIKDLPRWSRDTRVVVLTAAEDALSVQRALMAGASGYVCRRDPVAAVISALVGALRGERFVGPRAESALFARIALGGLTLSDDKVARLSDREHQIFRQIGFGQTATAIAVDLHLSVKTVHTHRQRIKEKLQLRDGGELYRQAVLYVGGSAIA